MKKIIPVFAVCALLASCVKDEDKVIKDVSKTTYVMDGRWQLKNVMWTPDIGDENSLPQDAYTPMDGCVKDNYFIFNTTSQVSLYEGDTKCNLLAPDSIVYQYAFSNNDGHLTIWADPEDPAGSMLMDGDMTYPAIDTFVITYTAVNPENDQVISRYTKTYAKLK